MSWEMQSQYITATGEKIPPYVKGPWRFTKIVREGERYPKGYGFCWHESFSYVAVCAPIPLNFIYGWMNQFHHWLLRGPNSSRYVQDVEDAYRRGRDETHAHMALTHYDQQDLRKAYHRGREHALSWLWVEFEIEQKEKRHRYYREIAEEDRQRTHNRKMAKENNNDGRAND